MEPYISETIASVIISFRRGEIHGLCSEITFEDWD